MRIRIPKIEFYFYVKRMEPETRDPETVDEDAVIVLYILHRIMCRLLRLCFWRED